MMSLSHIAQKAENCLRKIVLDWARCEYDSGVLVLRGCSRSYYDKQTAQEVVKHIDGVVQVVNEIEVVAGSNQPSTKGIYETQVT
jgi:osmotically-inducible protein OsmY